MKILQLVTKRQYRGAEVFAANLSLELILLEHEIIFAGLYKNQSQELFVDGAENIDISEKKAGFLSPQLVLALARLVKNKKPDVVQCNGSDTLKYMVAASFFASGVPIIYRNISMISNWVNTRPKKIVYNSIFKKVSHVSAVGDEAAKDFINTFNFPASKVSVIRRGIPINEQTSQEKRLNYRKEWGFTADEMVAVHIGNFSPEKNHEFLFDLFSQLKSEYPNIKLVCVGEGELFDHSRETVANRSLDDNVKFLGFRKDIPEILAAGDCFVLSSLVEGVPGVILEAAVQKKPAVATNVGGVSEVLIDGETGFLVDDFDQKEFKAKLVEVLMNKDLRETMGRNAYKLVLDEFNPAVNAKKFENLYKTLITNSDTN